MTVPTTLFVSFTRAIRTIAEGKVSQEELDAGMFYFGCAREHAYNPERDMTDETTWFAGGKAAHLRLIIALDKAEKEGRARWKNPGEPNSYGTLNELLVVNDLIPIDYRGNHYNYSEVADRMSKYNKDIRVVY
ncbi:MAG: hypothetical protein Q7R79_04735 [bacterium]|nr:hypothetical protein [bacterium]